jgi:hypothetical protein
MWRAAARAMLCLSVACSAAFPAAPRHGGPAWCELASEHFTVWTDGDPARVRELIRAMERFHHVAAGVAYPSAQSSGRSLAIVLRDDRELIAPPRLRDRSVVAVSGCGLPGAPVPAINTRCRWRPR